MGKVKFLAAALAAIMLMPIFTSCSAAGKKGTVVVKENDPWYESFRVKINKDIRSDEDENISAVCTSEDKIFYLYSLFHKTACTNRAVLDTYDFDGNLVSRKELICEDDAEVHHVYYLNADPDGKTLQAAVGYYVPGNIVDEKFIDIDVESGKVSNVRKLVSKEAEIALDAHSPVPDQLYKVGDYLVASFSKVVDYVFSTELLLYKQTDYVARLDTSSIQLNILLDGFSIDEAKGSLFVYGYEKGNIIRMEFNLNNGNLKNKETVQPSGGDSVNLWEFQRTNTGDMLRIDSLGNILKADVNTMTTETVIDSNWYTPYYFMQDNEEHLFSTAILTCSNTGAVLLDHEFKTYGSDVFFNDEYFRILKKTDKNPHAGKKVIELALPPDSGFSEYMANSISEFNRTDNEYVIRLWDKYKNGYATTVLTYMGIDVKGNNDQEVFQMIQDLKCDDAPDLVLDIQKNYAMRDDVFMDISDFLDPEVLDMQYKNIIEAGRIDGKLYFLPVTIEIEGLVTDTELLNEGAVGITFEDFNKLIKDKMSGFSPYDYPESTVYNKRSFILSCIDTKSAIEGQRIEFGTDQFRAAAEYAKNNINYNNKDEIPADYVHNWKRYRGKCYYAKIDDYLKFVHSCYKSKGNYKIIGTPSVDAKGPRFIASETVSVSATTDVKDGCRKFINYLFSGKAYDSTECEFRHIVTNREIMEKNIQILTKCNNDSYAVYENSIKTGVIIPAPGLDMATGDKYATDEMARSFLESLASISTYYYEDYTIVQFIDEELAPYYAGDRSIDDAVRYINDRVTKYVREM